MTLVAPSSGAARLAAAVLLALAVGCGGEEPEQPRRADRLTISRGDNQSGPVGLELPEQIEIVAGDAKGPLAGVQVGFSLADQSGFLSVPSVTTSATGVASVRWTVGGSLGTQTLTATVAGVTPVTVRATVREGPPALLTPLSAANQFVVVNGTAPSPPAVRVTDAFGNPLAGQTVTFADGSGRSTVVGGTTTSDASGEAGITSWTIGGEPGSYTLLATAGEGVVTSFVAFGTPAFVQPVAGDGQSANAGTAAPVAAKVRALDDRNQPLANVGVTFRITGGAGRLLANPNARTGSDGIATAPGWILGPTPGPNELVAEVSGVLDVAFHATGIEATPAAVAITSGAVQSGLSGNFAAARPSVLVTDAQARPVAGVPVSFALTAGGGALAGALTTTDFTGFAALGSWRYGAAGPQGVQATVGALPPVQFQATVGPPPASGYQIAVRFIGAEPSPSQRAAFESAAATWSGLILGDLEDTPFNDDLRFCGDQVIDEVIDDLLIFAKVDKIDGAGGILGQAGACYLRDTDSLSLIGFMQFDSDDVASLESSGRFRDVVLHEMGHVIGIGSLWNLKGLLTGRQTADPHFTGGSGRMAFAASATTPFQGNIVPVENSGGGGTRDVHWRETVLGAELMTGFLNFGTNPLSAITAASLRDEGYLVNDAVADQFSFGQALQAATAPPASLHLRELTPFVRLIDRQGRVRRIVDLRDGPFKR